MSRDAEERGPRRMPGTKSKQAISPVVSALDAEAEQALREMEAAMAEMEASPVGDRGAIVHMQQRLYEGRASLAQTDLSLNNFDQWRPGTACRWHRERLGAGAMVRAVLVSGTLRGIVGLAFVPLAIMLLAFVVVTLLRLFPENLRVIHLVITDLFSMRLENVFSGLLFMFLAIFAWMWLCFDCAFSPREVELDWKSNLLSVRGRRTRETARLSDIQALVVRPVCLRGESPSKEQSESLPVRLEAHLPHCDIVLLETDQCEMSTKQPRDRILPLAKSLARSLGVDIRHELPVPDNFDVVGFPRVSRLWNAGAIWRNSGRAPKLAFLMLLGSLAIFYGNRASVSYHENVQWLLDRQEELNLRR